jgi:CheY-like chemotaxis protein
VRSTHREGSCFSIELPLALEGVNADNVKALAERADGPVFHGAILVIEDDSFVRSGIEMLLAAEGSHVIAAANGHEALDLVTTKGVRPELVLSDFNLPGRMNGVEAIQAVREAVGQNIPAIVLTGDIRSDVLDAIAKHDVRIATKPMNADQLMQLVRERPAEAAAE